MIVIADDLTGAAEIAGIATTHGLQVNLVCDPSHVAAEGLTVIATDTRSMTEAAAVAETQRVAAIVPFSFPQGHDARFPLLFKKTDSALRGHVVAELSALMKATGKQRAIYLPANPSKGRTISNGIYYIDGIPIADTAFSYDPEFPALTSRLAERFPTAVANGIAMPDATTMANLDAIVADATCDTLLAGGADLFEAVLRQAEKGWRRIILCGSTQSRPLSANIVAAMPLSVYDGNDDVEAWLADARTKYETGGCVALTIAHRHHTGKATATHLRQAMATVATRLFQVQRPQELIVEGGATAFATLQQLGIGALDVVGQLAPGVVRMRSHDGLLVTLKPGSYPWRSEK